MVRSFPLPLSLVPGAGEVEGAARPPSAPGVCSQTHQHHSVELGLAPFLTLIITPKT